MQDRYSKYEDKNQLNQERDKLDPDLRELFDRQVDTETKRVLDRLRLNPHMLRQVATNLAKEVLDKDETARRDVDND